MGKAIIYECVSKCDMIIPQRNKVYLFTYETVEFFCIYIRKDHQVRETFLRDERKQLIQFF
jgi:hypothetical protein